MQKVWIQRGLAVASAIAVLLAAAPLKAADTTSVKTVAEELDKRVKPAETGGAPKDHLSDSSVRVMTSFAWTVLPNEYPGTDGKSIKVDKSDPTKFFIPIDDARRVIRVATRSAYAEACKLVDLEKANYEAMIKSEEARKVWSRDQLLFINVLHMFSVAYFTGNAQMTEEGTAAPKAPGAAAEPAEVASGDAAAPADQGAQYIAPKKLDCTPEQKEKVQASIAAYVKAAEATPTPAVPPAPQAVAPTPQAAKPAPANGGAN
jgi:hypothetical protein